MQIGGKFAGFILGTKGTLISRVEQPVQVGKKCIGVKGVNVQVVQRLEIYRQLKGVK